VGKNKKGEEPTVPSGEFCRLLRPEGQALLLVYPVTPLLDKDPVIKNVNGVEKKVYPSEPASLEHPLIGLALSFSASDRVQSVQYAVDDTVKRMIFGEDPDAGWDDDAEEKII